MLPARYNKGWPGAVLKFAGEMEARQAIHQRAALDGVPVDVAAWGSLCAFA